MHRKNFIASLFGLALAATSSLASAQDKPLEWVVGYAAGGPVDAVARQFAPLFAKALGLAPPGIEKSELLRECLQAFIRQQAAKRLAALGGQVPEIELAPRQRQAPAP